VHQHRTTRFLSAQYALAAAYAIEAAEQLRSHLAEPSNLLNEFITNLIFAMKCSIYARDGVEFNSATDFVTLTPNWSKK
jgi:hypothetical protein